MTVDEVIKAAIPDASDRVVEHIAWAMTPFPCGVSAKQLYRAASRYKRAVANDMRLCDLCPNKVDGDKWTCDKCERILDKLRKERQAA